MAYGSIKADKLISSAGDVDLTSIVQSPATQAEDGLLTAADKTKLDGVETGAQVTTVQPSDLPTVGDGTITLQSYGENAAADATFHTNQILNQTIVLPLIRYEDISGAPGINNIDLDALPELP